MLNAGIRLSLVELYVVAGHFALHEILDSEYHTKVHAFPTLSACLLAPPSREQAAGTDMRPLCFVLPSAMKENLQDMHHILSTRVVRRDDVLLNVFPKHEAEIQAYPYPSQVEEVMDPTQFATRLCECGAVVASRLHGAIIALQAGVPTIAAWPEAEGNKVPDLMKDVLGLPDQFLLVDKSFSRSSLVGKVKEVQALYFSGRRDYVFGKLESISLHTRQQSALMLADIAHVQLPGVDSFGASDPGGGFWRKMGRAHGSEENLAGEVGMAASAPEAANKSPRIEVKGEILPLEGRPSRWDRWKKQSRRFGRRSPTAGVGDGASFAGSFYLALAALAMIAALAMPCLAFRSRRETGLMHHAKEASSFGFGTKASLAEEAGELAAVGKMRSCDAQLGGNQFREVADVAFFGINYVLWVVLATGFNVCSKTYLRQTQNPVALLAIQGWVGVIVLLAMNEIAGSRRRRGFSSERGAFSPASCPATSPSSSSSPAPSPPSRSAAAEVHCSPPSSSSRTGPSSAGKCGLREARRLGKGVWQAGLLHSGNAVLTSWSVLVGGVAVTHALKALEPVAAAGFSRWLLGSPLPPGRAAGVAIIVLGLVTLMVPLNLPRWAGGGDDHSPDGEQGGSGGQDLALPAVLTACACCSVALRNVLLKKPERPPPPPLGLLACTITGAAVGSMALLVPWLPCSWEWAGQPLLRTSGVNAALCAVGYNLASFNLLSELSPVGHAVGNASKRVLLFASGLFLLGEEGSMSPRQLAGATIAFVGMASYNLAGTFVTPASPSSR